MAEMTGSALVQDAVSRIVSFGFSRREEKASQGDLLERLEMAISKLEFAHERAKELPIRHISLLDRRKKIKDNYIEGMKLLDRHKQRGVPAGKQLQSEQGVKRKRWFLSITFFAGLSTAAVQRFERYADEATNFVRDLESGCSLHHHNFCSPILRDVLAFKYVFSCSKQGNLQRGFFIFPTYSDERGMEAVLVYSCDPGTVTKKIFTLLLVLRLSGSTDIVAVAIKGMQILTSGLFKLGAEFATGELTQLYNSEYITTPSNVFPPLLAYEYIKKSQALRPDPTCCSGSRHGLCPTTNSISLELADIFSEELILFRFDCNISALEPRSSRRSLNKVGKSNSRGGGSVGKPPLVLRATIAPHLLAGMEDCCAGEKIGDGDVKEYRYVTIKQVAETMKSNAINCLRQPEVTKYAFCLSYGHGVVLLEVEKPKRTSGERAGPKTRRRYIEEAQGEVAGGS